MPSCACHFEAAPIAAILAARYQGHETEAASTFNLTALTMIVTYPIWIWVTGS